MTPTAVVMVAMMMAVAPSEVARTAPTAEMAMMMVAAEVMTAAAPAPMDGGGPRLSGDRLGGDRGERSGLGHTGRRCENAAGDHGRGSEGDTASLRQGPIVRHGDLLSVTSRVVPAGHGIVRAPP